MKTPIELQQDIECLKSFLDTVHESCTWDDSNHESISNMWMNSYNIVTELEAAQPKWIPFNKETSKHFETLKNPLLLFDNGQLCMYDDEHPFAIMTHFYPLPEIPSPPKTNDNGK